MKNLKNQTRSLNPMYVSGLVQADGSFFCVISKNAKSLYGLYFRPTFTVTLDIGSLKTLQKLQEFFGCGKIFFNKKRNVREYTVTSLPDLVKYVIPHFIKYPLYLDKLHRFKLFVYIVEALYNKTHRTIEERKNLLTIALSINISTQRKESQIKELYSMLGETNSENIPLIKNTCTSVEGLVDPYFIVGFIDGDGSFPVSFGKLGTIKPAVYLAGYKTVLPLLKRIQSQLKGVGSIQFEGTTIVRWVVSGIHQIHDVIIPFMDQYLLDTEKAVHYDVFRKVCIKIVRCPKLTLSERLELIDLAYNINIDGKRRRLSKEEYVKMVLNHYKDLK